MFLIRKADRIPAAEMTTWYGLFATGGTPKPVVDRLAAELKRILALPDVQAKLKGLGGEPGNITVEQLQVVAQVLRDGADCPVDDED